VTYVTDTGTLRQVLLVLQLLQRHLLAVQLLHAVHHWLMLSVIWTLSRHCSKLPRTTNVVFPLLSLTRRLSPFWKSICISVISRYFNWSALVQV